MNMKKKAVSLVLSAAAVAALAVPALAGERPMNLTIAPKPENVTIAPKPDELTIAPNPGQESVICPPNPAAFTDVAADGPYLQAVAYVQNMGLMGGTGVGTFAPEAGMTRAMLLTTLWRLQGSPVVNFLMRFEDVKGGEWYGEAVRWAASERIIDQEAAAFRPDEVLNREDFCKMVYAYAQYREAGFQGTWAFLLPFEDRADMAEDAYEPVAWCVVSDVLDHAEGDLLQPKAQVSRGQAAIYLQRLCESQEW